MLILFISVLTYIFSFHFLMIPRPPISTLFPYTTLFRSLRRWRARSDGGGQGNRCPGEEWWIRLGRGRRSCPVCSRRCEQSRAERESGCAGFREVHRKRLRRRNLRRH